MTKAEPSKAIASKTGLRTTDALKFVEAFMSAVKENIYKGSNTYMRGFGPLLH